MPRAACLKLLDDVERGETLIITGHGRDASIPACWALQDEQGPRAEAAFVRIKTEEAIIPSLCGHGDFPSRFGRTAGTGGSGAGGERCPEAGANLWSIHL
jgi:hypothetical protein